MYTRRHVDDVRDPPIFRKFSLFSTVDRHDCTVRKIFFSGKFSFPKTLFEKVSTGQSGQHQILHDSPTVILEIFVRIIFRIVRKLLEFMKINSLRQCNKYSTNKMYCETLQVMKINSL